MPAPLPPPKAVHVFQGDVAAALEFLKRARWELRELRYARLYQDRLLVIDVNRDSLEIQGVGYPHPVAATFLRAVNAAFDPATLAEATSAEYKEFTTGRRHAWAEDRVM